MLGSEALSATTWCQRFSMETTPNVDDVLSGRPGRPGNWAVELGGPKPFRLYLSGDMIEGEEGGKDGWFAGEMIAWIRRPGATHILSTIQQVPKLV